MGDWKPGDLNAIRCPHCRTVAVSTHRRHLQHCACGVCFADGGPDYKRRGWSGEMQPEEVTTLPTDETIVLGARGAR